MSRALFTPAKVGKMTLAHRVAMAPVTRLRAGDDHVHSDLGVEYYRQRSSVPGTLVITEACHIDVRAGGHANAPGIYNAEQVAAWKKIVDVVHANGSFIYLQLWALGRCADIPELEREGGLPYVSAGDIPMPGRDQKPRPLTLDEIREYISWFGRAAKLGVHGAGFDGVEIHGANGFLVDQFIQDVTNNRTDAYGGSIENRARFALEAVQAAVDEVGASRVAIRLSPWERYQGMRMTDPIPTFSYVISHLPQDLAYIHLTEPRAPNMTEIIHHVEGETLDFARRLWKGRPMLLAGGYTPEDALTKAEEGAANGEVLIIAFGRRFIANPDLPARIRDGVKLNPYNRATFYCVKSPVGYIDYPFAEVKA